MIEIIISLERIGIRGRIGRRAGRISSEIRIKTARSQMAATGTNDHSERMDHQEVARTI